MRTKGVHQSKRTLLPISRRNVFCLNQVEKLWKEEGTEGPTDAHWEKARDPFRRFIGFGKEGYSNKAGVKPCFEDLRIIFRSLFVVDDGI